MSTILAVINLARWILAEKKKMEKNAEEYLSESRAKEWRLHTEKIFRALEEGNGNMKQLPKPVRWFFSRTSIDNRVGKFGMWFLKSSKLEKGDSVLDQPLYRMH